MSVVADREVSLRDTRLSGSYLLTGVIHAALGYATVHDLAGHSERNTGLPREYVLARGLFYETIASLYGHEAVTVTLYLGHRIWQALLEGGERHARLTRLIAEEASSLLYSLREQNEALAAASQTVIDELTDDTQDGLGYLAKLLEDELASPEFEASVEEQEEPLE